MTNPDIPTGRSAYGGVSEPECHKCPRGKMSVCRTRPGRSTAAAPVYIAEHQFCRTLLGQNASEAGGQHIRMTGWQEACVSEGSAVEKPHVECQLGDVALTGCRGRGRPPAPRCCNLVTTTSLPWDPGCGGWPCSEEGRQSPRGIAPPSGQ